MEKVRIGIVGCGNISSDYVRHARRWPILDVVACADMVPARAAALAKEFGIPKACSPDELLRDPVVQIVVNLTVPRAHAPVALLAFENGKHVVNEKPLAATFAEGQGVIAAAKQRGLRVASAPDTFLGGAQQTARKLIDDGAIGRPVAATAFMLNRGPESHHPDCEFYYQPGCGPMFDMGPYLLTQLMQCLGPVTRVSAMSRLAIADRTMGIGPKLGQKIPVATPDHIAGQVQLADGCIATFITSFAVYAPYHHTSPLTIFGTEGTLHMPAPWAFDGPVRIFRPGQDKLQEVPYTHREGYGRSVGVADLAYALGSGRDHRASGQRALAVLEVMEAFLTSARTGQAQEIRTPYTRPAPLPVGLGEGELDP